MVIFYIFTMKQNRLRFNARMRIYPGCNPGKRTPQTPGLSSGAMALGRVELLKPLIAVIFYIFTMKQNRLRSCCISDTFHYL
jgi:hypothetical protein